MATKTTKKKSVTQEPKEEVIVNSIKEENAELEKQKQENELLKKQMEAMQLQMDALLKTLQNNNQPKANAVDETCIVGSRIFNGATLASQNGDITIPIDYHEEIEVTYSELREIFKNPFGYKTMFKKDMFYFVNEEDYKRFGIRKEYDLSDEGLISLLENNSSERIIEKLKAITNNKKDFMEMFTVIYQIAYLISERKIDLDYEIRSDLEKYFGVDFKSLISNLRK